MKTNVKSNSGSGSRAIVTFLLAGAAFCVLSYSALGQLYVSFEANNPNDPVGQGYVGKYDTATGAAINPSLITGLTSPYGLALSANNLFVANRSSPGSVGKYDATTGATINASFIAGLFFPWGLVVSGNTLFVANSGSAYFNGYVGAYDATTGAAINASFITGLAHPTGLAVSGNTLFVLHSAAVGKYDATTGMAINDNFIDLLAPQPSGLLLSGNTLFASDENGNYNTVFEWNATTGALINDQFIAPQGTPYGLAVSGNTLYVANYGFVSEYDATTGATINTYFITGQGHPVGLALSTPASAAHVQQPINADGSSVFSERRGVVPIKLTLTDSGSPTCVLPPATIAVTRTAGATTGGVNESVYSMSADSGSNFKVDGCQYVFNLSSSALGIGTYRVDIKINGQVVGNAVFQLK
jgi:hypothetical protein